MKKIFLALFLISLVAAGCTKTAKPVDSVDSSKSIVSALITESNDNQLQSYLVNVVTKQLVSANPQIQNKNEFNNENLESYVGLPKVSKTTKLSTEINNVLVSVDKTQVLVTVVTFDLTKPENEFDGSYPVLSRSDYLCIVATKKCAETNVLINAYKAAEPSTWWHLYDSQKARLIGSRSGEGIGNAAPIQVYDIKTGKVIQKTPSEAYMPSGGYSPSGERAVLVDGKEIYIYEISNLSKPEKTYSLGSVVEENPLYKGREVRVVGWNKEEKLLAIGTDKNIGILNLAAGDYSTLYIDEAIGLSNSYWDSSMVEFTADSKFVVFVDTDVSGNYSVLKAINLETKEIQDVKRAKTIILQR